MTMRRISEILHNVAEQTGDITRTMFPWPWTSISGLRGLWSGQRFGLRFWPTTHPAAEGSEINYDSCRSLYRNDGEMALGSSFAKPIVDLQVSFMGIPTAATGNEATDVYLNECLQNHWIDEIQQMVRDSIRDSKVIVRMQKPDVLDPLMTLDEAEHLALECLPPERVDIERSLRNKRVIERAVIHHRMIFVMNQGDIPNGVDPRVEEHDVLEIITRENYRFFDQNTSQWLTDMQTPNRWGFVPLLEVYNEWDASLQGGQSDLETVIPFMRAFHDVLTQGLQAHQYHSTPKITMKLVDIAPFIKNNFPEVVDETTGEIKANGEISWRGREIIFIQEGEEIDFLEAESVLGDTKTLLEFLIDCICIASQTPEWAFMRVDSGSANSDRNAQTVPFVKKIEKKRRNYTKPVQELCKMALVARDVIPVRARLSWEMVRADDQIVQMQAFQQLVMGLEVARGRGEISDATYQSMIRMFLPAMGTNASERTTPDQPAIPQQTGTPVAGPGQQ
jgi:hypothetical protein